MGLIESELLMDAQIEKLAQVSENGKQIKRDRVKHRLEVLLQADELNRSRSLGGKKTAQTNSKNAAEKLKKIAKLWNESDKPERDRSGVISGVLGIKVGTDRKIVREAGLRKKQD